MNINILLLPLLLPLGFGFLGFFLPKLRNESCFLSLLFSLYYGIRVFLNSQDGGLYYLLVSIGNIPFDFRADSLSGILLILVSSFGLLILIYSLRSMRFYPLLRSYYLGFSLSIVCTNGILLSNNFFLFISFWFLFTFLSFLTGLFKSPHKSLKVSLISTLPLSIGMVVLLVYGVKGFLTRIEFINPLIIVIGLLIFSALYRIIEILFLDRREALPTTMAFIPSVLNRIIGFYLLFRITYSLFDLSNSQTLQVLLLSVGSVGILLPLIKSLFEKDLLFSFLLLTVSEAGWIVLSIGIFTLFGITTSLFYLINSLVYTTGLFLCLGCVRERVRTTSIDGLKGLVKIMPLTAISLIALSLSISGIPPLNGFFSKVLVYEVVLNLVRDNSIIWSIFLIGPIVGWVITFIYFIKLLLLLFKKPEKRTKETGLVMWVPAVLLGLASILSGIFVYQVLDTILYPSLPFIIPLIKFPLFPP